MFGFWAARGTRGALPRGVWFERGLLLIFLVPLEEVLAFLVPLEEVWAFLVHLEVELAFLVPLEECWHS